VNRTDRLYALVEELRAVAPNVRNATWLAERFEVSVRTIERDLGALQQVGVPIYAHAGRRGGYAIDETTTLPAVNFTPEEATAVALALDRQSGGPFAGAARVALLKILGAMSSADAATTEGLADRVRLFESTAPKPDAVPGVIERGIVEHRVVRLTCQDDEGRETRRDVEPVAFVGSDIHWYLTGWCRLRDGPRLFRMDRVRAAALTAEPTPPRCLDEVTPADEAAEMDYRIVTTGAEHPVKGGIFATGGRLPNYAVFCVVVDDVRATVAHAEELGGKVLVAPVDTPTGLVAAHLLDPSGNHFGIYSPPAGSET